MKEKLNKSWRCGIYLFAVFLFLFLILYFPARPHNQDNDLLDLEKNYQPQNEDPGKSESPFELLECDEKEIIYYLGIHEGRIAIFEKEPRGTVILKEVLPYPVKDVYYEELQKGIPFSTEAEKILFLESYTS